MSPKINFFRFLSCYCDVAIFLLLSLCLIVPSGYSYGAAMLFLGATGLLKMRVKLLLSDYCLIFALLIYFFSHVFLSYYHHLPLSSIDNPSRFLLAVPALIVLRSVKLSYHALFIGAAVGASISGVWSIWLVYTSWLGRAAGYMNPIQFGDIALLISVISLLGYFFKSASFSYLHSILCLLAGLLGLLAVLLSGARGAWLAFFCLIILFFIIKRAEISIKKVIWSLGTGSLFLLLLYFIPHSYLALRIDQTILEITNSSPTSISVRFEMWRIGLNAFSRSPLLGWGDIDQLKTAFPYHWIELNKIDNFHHLHNDYIDALAKGGVLGELSLLIAYLVPMYLFFINIKNANPNVRNFGILGFCLVFCCILFGLSQTFFAHASGATVYPFFLVLVWSYMKAELPRSNSNFVGGNP